MPDHGTVFHPRDEWDAVRETINKMAERWRSGWRDEWSIRPTVATFSLAVLGELQPRGRRTPKLLPEQDGALAFTWEGRGGKRYMVFGEDFIEESVLIYHTGKWVEVSYVEKAAPHNDLQEGEEWTLLKPITNG